MKKSITIITKEIEPRHFTLIFSIDGTYSRRNYWCYNLEECLEKAKRDNVKFTNQNLWWWWSTQATELINGLKNCN